MRKSLLLIIFLFSITNVYADTGYDWDESDLNTKQAVVYGYLSGYRAGFFDGELQGSTNTLGKLTEFETAGIVDLNEKNKIISKNLEPFQKVLETQSKRVIEKGNVFFEKSPADYTKEIEAFFQTFPLCKREDFSNLMYRFLNLWKNDAFKSGQDRKITYKTIGDMCIN